MQYTVSVVEPGEVSVIPNLLKLVYNDSFTQQELYDPGFLRSVILEGQSYFFVAYDKERRPRGLLGLRFYSNDNSSAELIPIITDPSIRGSETGYILKLLIDACSQIVRHLAQSQGLRILYASATTDHDLIKQLCGIQGFVLTGILVAWIPQWGSKQTLIGVRHREINREIRKVDKQHNKRRTDLLYTRVIKVATKVYNVSIPDKFSMILKDLYKALGSNVQFVEFNKLIIENAAIEISISHLKKRAEIEVKQMGKNLVSKLKIALSETLAAGSEVIQVMLPLNQSEINTTIDYLLASDFKFCGLLPFYKGQDVIIFQYFNCHYISIENAILKTPLDRKIYNCVFNNTARVIENKV